MIDWSDVTKLQTRDGREVVAVFDSAEPSLKLVVSRYTDGSHAASVVIADTGRWRFGEEKDHASDIIPKKNDPGTIKPQTHNVTGPAIGMTLRDWFAGQALIQSVGKNFGRASPYHAAKEAYQYADAMMAEREKEKLK